MLDGGASIPPNVYALGYARLYCVVRKHHDLNGPEWLTIKMGLPPESTLVLKAQLMRQNDSEHPWPGYLSL